MSEVIINEQNLIDIADAIRLKLGVETEYKPSEMAGAIEEIEGGTYGTKEIDSNGTYTASNDGYTGYSQVTVNVPQSGGEGGPDLSKTAFTLFGYPQRYNSNYAYLDNYIVNHFKNSDAAIFTNKYLEDTTKPWEIGVMFKVSALLTRSQVLFGAWSNYYKAPSLEVSSTGRLWLGYTNTAGAWSKSLLSEYVLDLDTWYFVKVTYSPADNLLTLAITKDFVNWNTETANVTGYQYTDGINSAFEFGGLARSSNHCATNVSIDIRNTYIKEDGEITWGCYYRGETPQDEESTIIGSGGFEVSSSRPGVLVVWFENLNENKVFVYRKTDGTEIIKKVTGVPFIVVNPAINDRLKLANGDYIAGTKSWVSYWLTSSKFSWDDEYGFHRLNSFNNGSAEYVGLKFT